jgi:hypothetical protein
VTWGQAAGWQGAQWFYAYWFGPVLDTPGPDPDPPLEVSRGAAGGSGKATLSHAEYIRKFGKQSKPPVETNRVRLLRQDKEVMLLSRHLFFLDDT